MCIHGFRWLQIDQGICVTGCCIYYPCRAYKHQSFIVVIGLSGQYNWLQSDKKLLNHDLPRKQGSNLIIAFLVRFYVESITQLRDTSTVELFYLNAKQSVLKISTPISGPHDG
ncbi:FERM domain-containing protein 4B [Mactra antiquata]